MRQEKEVRISYLAAHLTTIVRCGARARDNRRDSDGFAAAASETRAHKGKDRAERGAHRLRHRLSGRLARKGHSRVAFHTFGKGRNQRKTR